MRPRCLSFNFRSFFELSARRRSIDGILPLCGLYIHFFMYTPPVVPPTELGHHRCTQFALDCKAMPVLLHWTPICVLHLKKILKLSV